MTQTLISNWQYLTLLIAIVGGWLSTIAILHINHGGRVSKRTKKLP